MRFFPTPDRALHIVSLDAPLLDHRHAGTVRRTQPSQRAQRVQHSRRLPRPQQREWPYFLLIRTPLHSYQNTEAFCVTPHSKLKGQPKVMCKQECIPVGCVPSTAVAVSWMGGVSARRVSDQGVSVQGGVCPGGCLPGGVCPEGWLPREVCLGGVWKTPPCEQNDRQV